MNKVIMMGRMTRDPEITVYGSGDKLARISIAVDRRFKKEGEAQADFFDCTAFKKTAEIIEKYMHKGTKVVIDGELRNNHYEKNGVKHYAQRIIINSIEFAESKKNDSSGGGSGGQGNAAPQTDSDGFMDIPDGLVGEELPFA